jgi:hypothetical protein
MATPTPTRSSPWHRLPEVRWLSVLVAVEALALVGYFALSGAAVTSVRYVLYPFVWINVGVVAVVATATPAADRRTRFLAAAVAALYFLTLSALSGLVGLELGAHSHSHVHGLAVTMSAPGWGPRVAYAGSLLTATFVPFRVVGYLALSYLVYATLLDAAGRAVSGVLGLASCLSCGLPVVGSLAVGVVGTVGGVAVAAYSVDVSTAVFVAAVALLTLRPGRDP